MVNPFKFTSQYTDELVVFNLCYSNIIKPQQKKQSANMKASHNFQPSPELHWNAARHCAAGTSNWCQRFAASGAVLRLPCEASTFDRNSNSTHVYVYLHIYYISYIYISYIMLFFDHHYISPHTRLFYCNVWSLEYKCKLCEPSRKAAQQHHIQTPIFSTHGAPPARRLVRRLPRS